MGIRQTALEAAINLVKFGTRMAGRERSGDVAARVAEAMAPVIDASTPHGTIHFFCPGSMPAYRAHTLLTKEPETLRWIDGFETTDVFWDIGANVGMYSLYAALRSIVTVSFEPSAGNYYLLNRNIEINHMDAGISAFCLALGDETRLDSFNMQTTALGGALSTFAHAEDWRGESFVPVFRQSMAGFTVDRFIEQFTPAFPNHIKVDVDGAELRIVRGARHTFADRRVKSALIELDTSREEYCNEIMEEMKRAGLTCVTKEHAPEFDHSQYSDAYNCIFRRSAA
jgi:FkbM family methyltransferase